MKNIGINRPFFLLTLISLISLMTITHSALAGEQATPDATTQITEITLQRTWCYGFCPIDNVVLESDGTAEFTGTMHAARTGDFKGTVDKYSFTRLAQWLESEDIFEMKDSYGEPNTDVSDHIISVVKNNQRKTIVNHVLGSSLKCWGMEQAILGVASNVKWQPVQSGIRGNVIYRSKTSADFRPSPNGRIAIRAPGAQVEFVIEADKDGNFQIPLLPNTYVVRPLIFDQSQHVIVQSNQFSDVTIKIDWHNTPPK